MRILLAEDEISLSKALVAILKHNNYSVDAVYNGQDCLDYVDSISYDALILDIMMPKVDGITVLKTMRERKNKTPVIILTAKSELDDKVLGLNLGADDYLTKPFASKELLARIRAITRRNTDYSSDMLEYNGLILNRYTYEISYNDKMLKLNNKEYQLLETLMRSPERIFSTEQLMEYIWGLDSESDLNVVWVYISNIRKKLKQLDAPVTIKASRNIGYALVKENV